MTSDDARSVARAGRVRLAHAPTPIEPLDGLTRLLGGPELWIKRDDLTGLGLGGNKVRKLEFLVAEARSRGADTLVTIGATQSNHVRLTAAAARASDLETVSILFPAAGGPLSERKSVPGEEPEQGNLLLDRLFGSAIEWLPFGLGDANPERVDRAVGEILARIEASGRKPFFIPAGGAVPVGCLGYVRAAEEIANQSVKRGVSFDTVVVAVGTGGTLAGLIVGVQALGLDWRMAGISVMKEGAAESAGIAPIPRLVEDTGTLIGIEASAERVRWSVTYDYVGEDYGVVDDRTVSAIRTVARTDAVLLDPVYTAKAMAGLIDLVESGKLTSDQRVLFLHTGGSPALFAHAGRLLAGPADQNTAR